MERPYNFSSGPATFPTEVLQQAQAEMLDWQGSGMCVMEMSHRSPEFQSIIQQAEQDVRELLNIPDNYHVLFLQGGASSQFAMVPMNLLGDKTQADYVNTGIWSKKAIAEARRFCEVNVVASAEPDGYITIPPEAIWQCRETAAYLHYTPNETINGVEFHTMPPVYESVPLVADMSSTLLSRPIDVSKFGLIYAGAQKNIGPAGLTLVIVRQDLLGQPLTGTPTMLDYATHAAAGSRYNTPPTYAWYLTGLVFKWLKRLGGVTEMADRNARKAHKLYTYIDDSGFYVNRVDSAYRSWMNIPFSIPDRPELESQFISAAKQAGLLNLGGHRTVGGMRASLYNAMPEAGVDALIAFMQAFAEQHG